MGEKIQFLPGETVVAELSGVGDYIHHRNHVVCVTDRRLVFLKKKVVGAYYTIQYESLADCRKVRYARSLALAPMVGGLFLAAIGLLVFGFALSGDLKSLRAAIFGIPLLGVGAALVFGVRRHKLWFDCGGQTLVWVSRAGEYRKKRAVVEQVHAFALERGIAVEEFPPAAQAVGVPVS